MAERLLSIEIHDVTPAHRAEIDVIRRRLAEQFGYDEKSAEEVLHYVAALFARGEAKKSAPEAA